ESRSKSATTVQESADNGFVSLLKGIDPQTTSLVDLNSKHILKVKLKSVANQKQADGSLGTLFEAMKKVKFNFSARVKFMRYSAHNQKRGYEQGISGYLMFHCVDQQSMYL